MHHSLCGAVSLDQTQTVLRISVTKIFYACLVYCCKRLLGICTAGSCASEDHFLSLCLVTGIRHYPAAH